MNVARNVVPLLLTLAVATAAAQTGLPTTESGLRLEWNARTAHAGGAVLAGYIYNDNPRPAIKVRLLAEALDDAGQVVGRAVGYVVGAVPVAGRSYWEVLLKASGARYRVTVSFFELKEGSS